MKKILTSVSVLILLAVPGVFAKGGSNGGAKSGGSNMYKSGSQYKSKKAYKYEYQHKNKGDKKKSQYQHQNQNQDGLDFGKNKKGEQ